MQQQGERQASSQKRCRGPAQRTALPPKHKATSQAGLLGVTARQQGGVQPGHHLNRKVTRSAHGVLVTSAMHCSSRWPSGE